MKLSQLVESFVISNDEFEDYLNRATEQLAQELQSGKNARDAIHDLSLTFADQHNKAYDAYVRMQDALTARMHTLELDNASSAPEMGMEPEMGAPEMGADPEMMTDPMGDMEMDTPADSEMPSDSDMEDYAAVMDNEPEAEEAEVEESVNEASCGCCGNDPCDCDDDCDCKKVDESGILYKAGVKKYGKEGMKAIQSASGKGASAEEIGKIKDQHRKNKTEAVVEGDDKPYICVHAKKGKHECHASSSYEAAKKAAAHWKMKSTAGIDAHLAVEESVNENMDTINKIVADKQAGKINGMTVDMFTASAIKQVYDAVNEDNKAKLDDLMKTKEGVLKVANIAMKMLGEAKRTDEVLPAVASAAGAVARGVGAAVKAAPKIAQAAKVAGAVGKGAVAAGKGVAKVASGIAHTASDGQIGKSYTGKSIRRSESVEDMANTIMASSIDMSEKALPAALNQAHKDGKKKGDKIKVGDQEITLKSDPKPFHKMTDADLQKLDALEQRLNEKGCSSKMKK